MIHRIHTGEELTQDFTIYGFNGSVNNFNHVLFPGDLRDCLKCHVDGTQQVADNPPPGLLADVRLCATGTRRCSTTRRRASAATTPRQRPPTRTR